MVPKNSFTTCLRRHGVEKCERNGPNQAEVQNTCCQCRCDALWTTIREYPNVFDRKADHDGANRVNPSCISEQPACVE